MTDDIITAFFNNEETTATMDKHNGRRNKAYYRAARRNHIAKKRKISDEIYDGGWQCPDGALSKGKIHCSCWLCAFHEVPLQDVKRIEAMKDEVKEYITVDLKGGIK